MEKPSSEKQSKIPQHLRPFLRPSLTTEPQISQASYPYNNPLQPSPTRSVELCPPHWRLEPKRSLRNKLKLILLKDWQNLSPQTPRRTTAYERPLMMRM